MQAAREKSEADEQMIETQLPTPPDDDSIGRTTIAGGSGGLIDAVAGRLGGGERFLTPMTNNKSSPDASPPPLDDTEPPGFEESQFDDLIEQPLSQRFDFPDPSSISSPTSSNEAEPDADLDYADNFPDDVVPGWRNDSLIDWNPGTVGRLGRADFGSSNVNSGIWDGWRQSEQPKREQEQKAKLPVRPNSPVTEIPIGESTLLDIDL